MCAAPTSRAASSCPRRWPSRPKRRSLPEWPIAIDAPGDPPGDASGDASGCREIRYEAQGGVGHLHFPFYNGAMSTAQCERLTAALRFALAQPPRVLVLFGGADFWSNGIHLNVIEAADSPADESWRNINAIDDVTQTLIEATDRIVIAAMQGNAGAGGVFMALAADQVWARRSVVLNPHYKNMGNLYGSEYWTYLLPRRLKSVSADDVMKHRLPVSASRAAQMGLVDAVFGDTPDEFVATVRARAAALAASAEVRGAAARQAAAASARRGTQAARRVPRGRTGPHAAQFLRLRPELPHRPLELRAPRRAIVDAAPSGDPPRRRRWPPVGRREFGCFMKLVQPKIERIADLASRHP